MIRYIPFWAIPIIFISLEFGYKYYLKRRRTMYMFFGGTSFFAFVLVVYYIWAGGPEKSVGKFMSIISN